MRLLLDRIRCAQGSDAVLLSAFQSLYLSTCCICWTLLTLTDSLSPRYRSRSGCPVAPSQFSSVETALTSLLCFPFFCHPLQVVVTLLLLLPATISLGSFSARSFFFSFFLSCRLLFFSVHQQRVCCSIQFVCVFLYMCSGDEANRAHFSRVRQLRLCIPMIIPVFSSVCYVILSQLFSGPRRLPQFFAATFRSCLPFCLYIFSCDMPLNLPHH